MRIRLSQRGWNNVLIFASIFLILLFNNTSRMFGSADEQVQYTSLLPETALIQTLDFSGLKFERIGTSWQVKTRLPLAGPLPASDYISAWRSLPLELMVSEPLISEHAVSLAVVAWVAGQQQGWVFEFFIEPDRQSAFIFDRDNRQWFILNQQQLVSLIPRVLLED